MKENTLLGVLVVLMLGLVSTAGYVISEEQKLKRENAVTKTYNGYDLERRKESVGCKDGYRVVGITAVPSIRGVYINGNPVRLAEPEIVLEICREDTI